MMYKKEYQEGGAMRFNPPKGDMAREMASQQDSGDEAAMAAQEQMQMFVDIVRQIPAEQAAQLIGRINQQLMEMLQGGQG
jgi:tetraacyldisaccharide-1-P 4'-kinase